MSLIRLYSKFFLISLCLFRTCSGQTCFPLYGSDTLHPNGLLIQLAPLKQPKQNTVSTYILQAPNYSEALWDPTQGLLAFSGQMVLQAVKTGISSCVPPIPPGT